MSEKMKLKNCLDLEELAIGIAVKKDTGRQKVILNLSSSGIEVQFSLDEEQAEIAGQGLLEAGRELDNPKDYEGEETISLSEVMSDLRKEMLPTILENMANDENVPASIRKVIRKELKAAA